MISILTTTVHSLCHFDSDMMSTIFLRGLGADILKSSLSFVKSRKLYPFFVHHQCQLRCTSKAINIIKTNLNSAVRYYRSNRFFDLILVIFQVIPLCIYEYFQTFNYKFLEISEIQKRSPIELMRVHFTLNLNLFYRFLAWIMILMDKQIR